MNLSATGQMIAQRDAFGDTLVELVDRDEDAKGLDSGPDMSLDEPLEEEVSA